MSEHKCRQCGCSISANSNFCGLHCYDVFIKKEEMPRPDLMKALDILVKSVVSSLGYTYYQLDWSEEEKQGD